MPLVSEDHKPHSEPLTILYRLISARDGEVVRFTGIGEPSEHALDPVAQSGQAKRDGWPGFLESLIQSRYRHAGIEHRFNLVPLSADYSKLVWHREVVVICVENVDAVTKLTSATYQISSPSDQSDCMASAHGRGDTWSNVLEAIRISTLKRTLTDVAMYLDRLPPNYETRKVAESVQRSLHNDSDPVNRFYSARHGAGGVVRLKVEVSSEGVIVRTDGDERQNHSIQSLARDLAKGYQMPPLKPEAEADFASGKMFFNSQTIAFEERETRIAKAICTVRGDNPDSPGRSTGNQYRWQDYIKYARAAIHNF